VRRARVIALLVLCSCGSRRLPLECPTEGPTRNDFEELKTYDNYDVEGEHPDKYLANARAKKPFSADATAPHGTALTESKMCLSWQLNYDAATCHVVAVRLQHRVRITLPKWQRPKDAPPAFVEWDRQTSAKLAQHEEGHYLIATAVARTLYERALTITTAPTCDELDKQFDALLKATQAEVLRKQEEFDAVTKHGTEDVTGS
jgi:predicted secreted Zn-dependent protease